MLHRLLFVYYIHQDDNRNLKNCTRKRPLRTEFVGFIPSSFWALIFLLKLPFPLGFPVSTKYHDFSLFCCSRVAISEIFIKMLVCRLRYDDIYNQVRTLSDPRLLCSFPVLIPIFLKIASCVFCGACRACMGARLLERPEAVTPNH